MIYFTQKLNHMIPEGPGLTEKICRFIRLKNMKMKNIQFSDLCHTRQKDGHIVNLLNTIPAEKGIHLFDFENKHSGREKISKITEL